MRLTCGVRLFAVTTLLHEVWEEPDENGQMLPGLCLAGPDGNGFRSLLEPGSQLVATFEATCHFEAMNKYYQLFDYGEYTSEEPRDHAPYPEEWAATQGRAPSH